jgi:hypothetical protein
VRPRRDTALDQAIRGARRSVLIAGRSITPEFALLRNEPPVLLRELLGEAAKSVDVRVLLWAGAPVPVFKPRRTSVRAGRDALVRGTRIKTALDSNERPMHCHHEKLVVIDDELALVGGIDLTDLGAQPADEVADAGEVKLQIVRNVPEKLYEFAPRGDVRITEAYLRALRSAQQLDYPGNQFLWSPEIVNLLADKLRRAPADEFRPVIADVASKQRKPKRFARKPKRFAGLSSQSGRQDLNLRPPAPSRSETVVLGAI